MTHQFGGKKVLNIGCGFAKYPAPNVVNLDMFDNCKPNVVHDLSKMPMPFPDNEFDLILANHILEHVPNWWACFGDCCRVLKPGGTIEVWVPGMGSDAATGYRDHINTINHCSWFGIKDLHSNPGNAWAAENNKGPATQVSLQRQMIHLENKWWLQLAPQSMKRWFAEHLRNTVFENGFIFRKEA